MRDHYASPLTLALVLLVGCGRSYVGPADATLEAFVPAGLDVHDTHRATFTVNGREVALTHVEYGQLMDCASGCFASHVCAIEEHTETYPDCEPPGLSHPVTATAEFAAFARDQIGSGPLRMCVNRYGDRF
jgi:hypothetical protein